MATEAGVTQAVFPEGGLSRTGALGKPKLGLISYILDGFRPGQSRDVVFVPVAINYDRVMEDRNLIEAQANGARAFRFSIRPIYRYLRRQTWLRLTGKFHRYGYAAVCFGDPLSLTEFLGVSRPDQPRRWVGNSWRASPAPCRSRRCRWCPMRSSTVLIAVRSSSKASRPGSRRQETGARPSTYRATT
jgi:glycerol-3-phosphate O-acyltransferase